MGKRNVMGKGTRNRKRARKPEREQRQEKGRETGKGARNRKGDQKQERGPETVKGTGKLTGKRKRDGSPRFDCLVMRVSGHWLEPHGNVIYILLRRVGIKWFPQVLFSLDLYIAT